MIARFSHWRRCSAACLTYAACIGVSVLLGACSALPPMPDRTESHAISARNDTSLATIASNSLPAGRDDLSGFRLMHLGPMAFDARMQLIARAQRTLDLQYYQVNDDQSGRQLFVALRDAAQRGVRVRLLIDDLFTVGQDDRLLALTGVPKIEVRLFNPFTAGRASFTGKFLMGLNEFSRINHRMHNKLFIADNAFAISGGRNIGDEYFMYAEEANFIDIDALMAGPVVADLSKVFDEYWNSQQAYPLDAIAGGARTAAMPPTARHEKDSAPAKDSAPMALGTPLPPTLRDELGFGPVGPELDHGSISLNFAKAVVFCDSPDKVNGINIHSIEGTVTANIMQAMGGATSEVIVVSPYFIPGELGMQAIRRLHDKHVRMVLVTNSLAATDTPLVHVGYSRYRKAMLNAGVEIFEVNPDRGSRPTGLYRLGSSKAMLHAKIAVIDRKQVFVGSMNSDPRSSRANTELGVIIQSPTLAAQILTLMRKDSPGGSFAVRLDPSGENLQWIKRSPDGNTDKDVTLTDEPGSSYWLSLRLQLLSIFATEELL